MDMFAKGVYPILYALFDEAGRLSREAMRAQIHACLNDRPAGVATLGLATEVRDLTPEERRQIVEWNAEDIAGRTALAVTIFEPTPELQIQSVRHAAAAGASWVILQPPATARDEAGLMRDYSAVIEASPLPAAFQNAPDYIGVGLGAPAIAELCRRHANLKAIKQEVSAVDTAALRDLVGDRLLVYSGRGGLELIDCIEAGIHGHVPAPEYADRLIEIWDLAARGETDAAYQAYRRILPLALFVMQSLQTLLTYGKFLFCARRDIPFFQRNKSFLPTPFGLRALTRHCDFSGISLAMRPQGNLNAGSGLPPTMDPFR